VKQLAKLVLKYGFLQLHLYAVVFEAHQGSAMDSRMFKLLKKTIKHSNSWIAYRLGRNALRCREIASKSDFFVDFGKKLLFFSYYADLVNRK